MWEDGFCRGRVSDCLEEIDGEDAVRKAFSKMSIQLYNYGEGWVLGRCFFLFVDLFLASSISVTVSNKNLLVTSREKLSRDY